VQAVAPVQCMAATDVVVNCSKCMNCCAKLICFAFAVCLLVNEQQTIAMLNSSSVPVDVPLCIYPLSMYCGAHLLIAAVLRLSPYLTAGLPPCFQYQLHNEKYAVLHIAVDYLCAMFGYVTFLRGETQNVPGHDIGKSGCQGSELLCNGEPDYILFASGLQVVCV